MRAVRNDETTATATNLDNSTPASVPSPCTYRKIGMAMFSTKLFARYQRNEKALVLALMEMYGDGVSTRKVREITEVLCGTTVSKSLVSELSGRLDEELATWRDRPLTGTAYPYLSVDAHYEYFCRDLVGMVGADRRNGGALGMDAPSVCGIDG